MPGEQEVPDTEAEAALAARADLGAAYDRELVAAFAERVEVAVEERARARVKQERARRRDERGGEWRQFALGLFSLGTGVPITFAAGAGDVAGIAVAWLGIVGVNVAHAVRLRGGRRRDQAG